MAAAGEDFDAKKELAVETMTKGEFQRWLMEQDSLVKCFSTKFGFTDICLLKVTSHVSSKTSEATNKMIALSKKGFTETGALLRKLAQVDTSNRRGRYNDEVKADTLESLRVLYENMRKSFIFALVNSTDGLSTASQIVDTGPSGLMSKKEQKLLSKLSKAKKERRSNFTDRSKLTCYKCNEVS